MIVWFGLNKNANQRLPARVYPNDDIMLDVLVMFRTLLFRFYWQCIVSKLFHVKNAPEIFLKSIFSLIGVFTNLWLNMEPLKVEQYRAVVTAEISRYKRPKVRERLIKERSADFFMNMKWLFVSHKKRKIHCMIQISNVDLRNLILVVCKFAQENMNFIASVDARIG